MAITLLFVKGKLSMIIYLNCATNSFSVTVLNLFLGPTRECGCQSRVCGDHSGGNIGVAEYTTKVKGEVAL